MSLNIPSRHIAVWRSERKQATHLIRDVDTFFSLSTHRSLAWLTKSKKPVMSNANAEVAKPLRAPASQSWPQQKAASVVDLPTEPPNWLWGVRENFAAKYANLLA